jgi:hypothetical protein
MINELVINKAITPELKPIWEVLYQGKQVATVCPETIIDLMVNHKVTEDQIVTEIVEKLIFEKIQEDPIRL